MVQIEIKLKLDLNSFECFQDLPDPSGDHPPVRPLHRAGLPPHLLLPLHLLFRLRGAQLLLLLPPAKRQQGRVLAGAAAAEGEEDWGDLEDKPQRAAAERQWKGVKTLKKM